MFKTIKLKNLKSKYFYHEGTKFQLLGQFDFGAYSQPKIIAYDDCTGAEHTFSPECEVEVEFEFNPEDLLEAFLYLESFKKFAKERMIRLHREYLSKDSQFFKNCETAEIEFIEEHDEKYELTGFYLNFLYGYASSGSFENNKILLSEIATPLDKWEAHMKELKEIQDRELEESKARDIQRSIESRRAQFEKLKAEFEPGEVA